MLLKNPYFAVQSNLQIVVQKYKQFWKRIVTLLTKKDVFHHASAITFNLITCSIPFVLLLVSIIGYVLSYEAAFTEVLRYGKEIFPTFTYQSGGNSGNSVVQGVITLKNLLEPLVSARQVFGVVGVTVLMFFSLGLVHTVKHVVFEIFDIKNRNHLIWEYIHNFFTFGLIGGIFVFFSIAISIFSVFSVQSITLPYTNEVIKLSIFYQVMQAVVPLLFTLLIIYLLLRYISEKRMYRLSAFVGATVFTVLFTLARFGVSIYLSYSFSRYHYYYQGYTILVIIGIWAFYSAALLVISIIISKAFQDIYQHEPVSKNPYTTIS